MGFPEREQGLGRYYFDRAERGHMIFNEPTFVLEEIAQRVIPEVVYRVRN